ncbi:tRNA modification GTPase GTPBP3, mitochondrial isoform X2 [Bacillus rossius redtenbacheri]|uniref:tRNA modification GTPase GTPBP3, mitochondrial isoform X2 n=1 Tax=Bacillus rossius redtenbacheri TaxID=93214 RepID=UPI002FDEB70A
MLLKFAKQQSMIFNYSSVFLHLSISRNLSASTIFALSSGYGKSGVAVIRVSGSQASAAAVRIGGLKLPLVPRHTFLRKLRDPLTNNILDQGIVIWFPGPRSFTGEDSCEFQVHGGPAVITAVLHALGKLHGFRPAEPGEFTKRAFHAGKLDLTEVEGLADLINAETDVQRKQALSQLEGDLSSLYKRWQLALKKNHLSDGRRGEILRNGVKAVIVGKPNVGKSSLLNKICQRPAAIVTAVAGTTRDVVEISINISGYPVVLADTAGLRANSVDVIEEEGISRARACASVADLILLVMDAAEYAAWAEETKCTNFLAFANMYIRDLDLDGLLETCSEREKAFVHVIGSPSQLPLTRKCVTILNKIDVVPEESCTKQILEKHPSIITLSCKTGYGFPELLNKLKENLVELCGIPSSENPCLTQARHRHHLNDCLKYLQCYSEMSSAGGDDILAHHLRKALTSLGRITGHVSTEEILDVIFKDFCIGK